MGQPRQLERGVRRVRTRNRLHHALGLNVSWLAWKTWTAADCYSSCAKRHLTIFARWTRRGAVS